MKQAFIGILSLGIFSFCNTATPTFEAVNTFNITRKDELVVLKRPDIENKTGFIANGKFLSITDARGNKPAVQLDDTDKDGKWDEAAFLYSFSPNETALFTITTSNANTISTPRAHVRLRKNISGSAFGEIIAKETMPAQNLPTDFSKTPLPLYLTEGPAWENDKVAFRLYFDTRNGKDIFGKLVPGMVMDTVGINANSSYHQMSNWGMDILHTGNSLGAGAVAFGFKENGKDTVIRLGGPNISNEVYEQIADGPVRAIFRITYNWLLNGKPVQVIDETSIWGGQYFYESNITLKNAPDTITMYTGVADFYNNRSDSFTTANNKVFYSYGPQSENHDNLGMAVIIPGNTFTKIAVTPKENYQGAVAYKSTVFDSYLVGQQLNNGKGIYRFYACWEKSNRNFADINNFKTYLNTEATLSGNPVKIRW